MFSCSSAWLWQVDPQTGRLSLADLDRLLDSRVRLIAAPHCSNVSGEINPVAEIAARAKSIGAVTAIDGVSYAPHGLPDLQALGADIYVFSAYKVYGPHQGVMAVRPDLAPHGTDGRLCRCVQPVEYSPMAVS